MRQSPFRSVTVGTPVMWFLYGVFVLTLGAVLGWFPVVAGVLITWAMGKRRVPEAKKRRALFGRRALTNQLPGGPETLIGHPSVVAAIYELRYLEPDEIAGRLSISADLVKSILAGFGDDGGPAGVGAVLNVPPKPRFGGAQNVIPRHT